MGDLVVDHNGTHVVIEIEVVVGDGENQRLSQGWLCKYCQDRKEEVRSKVGLQSHWREILLGYHC